MKYLLLFVFIVIAGKPVPIIAAKDAYKHVGEFVDVRDSIYSGKIVNDTTAVFQVGEKTSTPRLIMIYISRSSTGVTSTVDPRIVEKLQRTKIYIYGIITGSAQAPQITVDGSTGHMAFPLGKM